VKLPAWLLGRSSSEDDKRLVGCWLRIDPAPGHGEDAVEVHFLDNGELRYCVLVGDKWQIMKLTFRIKGDVLVTNQPTAPREERTPFSFDDNGALVLEFGGATSTYRRGEPGAPVV
jgi:hypothetical protein